MAIAADLVAWLRPLALTGPLATAEPKASPALLTAARPGPADPQRRRRHLRLPGTLPWVDDLVAAFPRIAAIPLAA